jgi:hypothetical protein
MFDWLFESETAKQVREADKRFFKKMAEGELDEKLAAGAGMLGANIGFAPNFIMEKFMPDIVDQWLGQELAAIAKPLIESEPVQEAYKYVDKDKGLFTDIMNAASGFGVGKYMSPTYRGQHLGALSNTIPGYYGEAVNDLGKTATWLRDQAKDKFMIPEGSDMEKALNRGMGIAQWGTRSGIDMAKGIYDPVDQARYRTSGIGRELSRKAKEFSSNAIEKPDPRKDIHPVVAQAQYDAHISRQRMRKGLESEAAQNLADLGGTHAKYDRGAIGDAYRKAAEAHGIHFGITDNDWRELGLQIQKGWPDAFEKGGDILVKQSSTVTGNHARDVFSSGVYKRIKNMFKKSGGYASVADLQKAVQELAIKSQVPSKSIKDAVKTALPQFINLQIRRFADKPNMPQKAKEALLKRIKEETKLPKGNSFKISEVSDDGVWVTAGFPGSALTEGGVNLRMKIKPNGKVLAVVSDEHDFVEKFSAGMFPKSQMMATTPLVKDLLDDTAKTLKGTNLKVEDEAVKLIKQIAKTDPSSAQVLLEGLMTVNMMTVKEDEAE